MNAKEFYYLVKGMRKAQRDYFATRDHKVLGVCRRYEREVDEEISRVEEILAARERQSLEHAAPLST